MKTTFNFFCIECDCENQTVGNSKRTISFELGEEEDENNQICPNSSEAKLKVMGRKIYGGHLKFASSSPAQKAAILDKRSQEHFDKKLKDKKHEMLKKAYKKN